MLNHSVSRIYTYASNMCYCCSFFLLKPKVPLNSLMTLKSYSKNVNRETRFMNKLLSKGGLKKKSKFYNVMPEPSSTPTIAKIPPKVNHRRMNVLNKLFMQNITGLMATGIWHPDFDSKGFEITRVAINPDFKSINVFWFSNRPDDDFNTVLNDIAFDLRHELSQLRLVGRIPKIIFVRDASREKFLEVENLFASLSLNNNSTEGATENSNLPEDIPEMPMDVYGLEHDKMLKKLGFGKVDKYVKNKTEEDS